MKNMVPRWDARLRSIVTAILLTQLLLSASGQEQARNSQSKQVPESDGSSLIDQSESWYRIGPGDVLDIRVFNRPQLSVPVRVNDRGEISLPLIADPVPAACRTERELAQEIASLYIAGKYLKNPQVDVFIKEYQASPVAVIGAVNGPGRFQLQRRMRLLEMLMVAGGPAAVAGENIQILHTTPAAPCEPPPRPAGDPEEPVLLTYRLGETLRGGESSNPYVWPGDIITIPPAGQVIILGNVAKPGPISITDQTTISNAMALAGGTLPDTKTSGIRILRPVPGSTSKTEITVDLAAIRKRQAPEVILKDGDIVEVPTTTGFVSVMKSLARTIVPTVSQLPVRVIRY